MTKQDKPWVVEEKTTLGMLPEGEYTSRKKSIGAATYKFLSGVFCFWITTDDGRMIRIHDKNNKAKSYTMPNKSIEEIFKRMESKPLIIHKEDGSLTKAWQNFKSKYVRG